MSVAVFLYDDDARCSLLTMLAMLTNSLSPVMGADWTRNLSRHLVPGAGSCFMA